MDEWWVYHRYVTDITNDGGQTSCSTAPLLSSAVPPYVVVFSEAVSKKIEIIDHWSLLLWDLTVLSFWGVLGTLSFLIFCFAWHNAWSDLGSLVRARLRLKHTLVFYAEICDSNSLETRSLSLKTMGRKTVVWAGSKNQHCGSMLAGPFWEAVKDK